MDRREEGGSQGRPYEPPMIVSLGEGIAYAGGGRPRRCRAGGAPLLQRCRAGGTPRNDCRTGGVAAGENCRTGSIAGDRCRTGGSAGEGCRPGAVARRRRR